MKKKTEASLDNDHFTFKGKRYIGIGVPYGSGCSGCAFQDDQSACASTPYCSAKLRYDKRTVIFVQAEPAYDIKHAIKILRAFNRWRRGDGNEPGFPNGFTAKELGEAIDTVLNFIERRIE